MNSIHDEIARRRVLPVVKLDDLAAALPLSQALSRGGLPLAEITLRTPCALESIRQIASQSDCTVGAGTVLNADQCQQALEAGAKFIVSPGLDEGVIQLCQTMSIPCYPGVSTASEIQRAANLGVRTVKFFPAESVGGVRTLSALAAPFHQMQFIPTGGICLSNLVSYLSLPCVLAVGGSWMVKSELYQDDRFESVVAAVSELVQIVKENPSD